MLMAESYFGDIFNEKNHQHRYSHKNRTHLQQRHVTRLEIFSRLFTICHSFILVGQFAALFDTKIARVYFFNFKLRAKPITQSACLPFSPSNQIANAPLRHHAWLFIKFSWYEI